MTPHAPWADPEWTSLANARTAAALTAAGHPPRGSVNTVKKWGRSCLRTVATDGGTVWIKHGYALPPGEEVVLEALSRRWPDRVPTVIATWTGAVAMEALPGRELTPDDPVDDWVAVARWLAELAAGEAGHADAWLECGVRDRRPAAWPAAVESLARSPVVRAIAPDVLRRFESLVPEFISRYTEAFESPATLVHQDSGCCNVHIVDGRPVIFDWADVVIGHPVFGCDRLLDQVPVEHRDVVIDAFSKPLGLSREAFDAMRRSNVLHEVIRYHDELAYLAPDDPTHHVLADAVRSQIRVLVEHEGSR